MRYANARELRRFEGPLEELPRLYRHACSVLAKMESRAGDVRQREGVRALVARAHTVLFAAPRTRAGFLARGGLLSRAWELLMRSSPRAIRSEWKLLLASFLGFYALATGSFLAVSGDLDLAYSLMDPQAVAGEIDQLNATPEGEPFVGNFDFGLGDSPRTAGWIMVHNMGVGVLFFASALLPPLYLLMLATNALMVGTYTAVAGHWGQAQSISSILWCHGTIELQTILLAGTAGAILVRALLAPGPWSRRHALTLESRQAWWVLAPVFPLLFIAGLIEGYISPHASPGVRLSIALASGLALVAWVTLGGRGARSTAG